MQFEADLHGKSGRRRPGQPLLSERNTCYRSGTAPNGANTVACMLRESQPKTLAESMGVMGGGRAALPASAARVRVGEGNQLC
jgi:hypothetical protein